jgi:uncharacterized protein YkwD
MSKLRISQSKRLLLVSLSVGILAPACAWARETYVQFAGRMISSGSFQPEIEKALFARVNAYRVSQGRGALQPDKTLQFAARAHAQDMASHGFMGHVASIGYDFESRMRAFRGGGVLNLPSLGENAADFRMNSAAPDEVAEGLFQEWLHSEEHRRNMVSRDYIKAAMGVAVGNGKAYADQIFQGPDMKSNIFGMGQQ